MDTILINGQVITLDADGYKTIFNMIDRALQNTARGMCYTLVQKVIELQQKQPDYTKLLINVNGGVVQGVRSTNKNVTVEVFDQDNMEVEMNETAVQELWDTKSAEYKYGVL